MNSAEFACLAMGLVQTVILTRVLGPARIGQYAIVISALMLSTALASLGFPSSFLFHSKRDPHKSSAYLMNAVWCVLLTGTVGGISLAALMWWQESYFGNLPWFALVGAALYVPFVLESLVARNSLLVQIEGRRLSLMSTLSVAGSVALVVVLYALGVLHLGQAVLCFVFGGALRAVIGWYWVSPRADFSIRPSREVFRTLASMGVRLSWVDFMVLLNAQLGILILKYLEDDFEGVGFFSRGLRIAVLLVTAGRAVLPLLFSHWADFPKEKLAAHVEMVMRVASTLGLAMIAGILLSAKWLVIVLYGSEFLPAVQPMMILLPGAVMYLLSRVLMELLGSRGVPQLSGLVLLLGAVVNVALSLLLIPVLGIAGAAVASTVANGCLLIPLMAIVHRRYGIRVMRCLLMNRRDWAHVRSSVRSRA